MGSSRATRQSTPATCRATALSGTRLPGPVPTPGGKVVPDGLTCLDSKSKCYARRIKDEMWDLHSAGTNAWDREASFREYANGVRTYLTEDGATKLTEQWSRASRERMFGREWAAKHTRYQSLREAQYKSLSGTALGSAEVASEGVVGLGALWWDPVVQFDQKGLQGIAEYASGVVEGVQRGYTELIDGSQGYIQDMNDLVDPNVSQAQRDQNAIETGTKEQRIREMAGAVIGESVLMAGGGRGGEHRSPGVHFGCGQRRCWHRRRSWHGSRRHARQPTPRRPDLLAASLNGPRSPHHRVESASRSSASEPWWWPPPPRMRVRSPGSRWAMRRSRSRARGLRAGSATG